MWFKKDEINKNKRKAERKDRIKAVNSARAVAEIFRVLRSGCEDVEELKERLETFKESNPEIFKANAAKLQAEITNSKIEGMEKVLSVAGNTTKDKINKLKDLKDLGSSSKKLLE